MVLEPTLSSGTRRLHRLPRARRLAEGDGTRRRILSLPMDRHGLLHRALRLSLLSIALGAVLGVAAVLVGSATDSLSLLGFGIDAAIDSVASVVLVWRFRAEVRQPHRAERIESLAERVIGGVLFVVAVYLTISAINALATGARPEAGAIRTVLLVVSVVVLPPALAKSRTASAYPAARCGRTAS